MNLTLFEASSLFLATDGEPELDQVDSAAVRKRSNSGHSRMNSRYWSSVQKPMERVRHRHGYTRSGQTIRFHRASRQNVYVTLEVPFTELTLSRFFQSNDACSAGIEMLHEATDGAALSGCVAAFEQNNDFLSSLLDPVLKFQKLDLKKIFFFS